MWTSMGWLDANEYFVIETAARERIEDFDGATAVAAATEDTGGGAADVEPIRAHDSRPAVGCRFRRHRETIGTPAV
jgi:hypothetical protein